jgi:hypothetical protein
VLNQQVSEAAALEVVCEWAVVTYRMSEFVASSPNLFNLMARLLHSTTPTIAVQAARSLEMILGPPLRSDRGRD